MAGLEAAPEQTEQIALMDSSRVSTIVISLLLIVYGCFRSLNMEVERREREKQQQLATKAGTTTGACANISNDEQSGVQTIDGCQAAFMPIGASASLLIMFLFFDSLQVVFAVSTAVLATMSFAFLLLPMCQYMLRPCSSNPKVSMGCCGRFTHSEILSFCLSLCIVGTWVMTGHWLLMDALGMGLCVAFIALVRLPSLKVSTLLLLGLLIYDVFWVFFSQYFFNANVMVKVASRPAENPVGALARKLNLGRAAQQAPKLSLPGKLVFPNNNSFSMLGLGDIVMPGLLLCFVMRYDAHRKSQQTTAETGLPPPSKLAKMTYFHCSLIGYFLGLVTATVSAEMSRTAQPALLYLVPFTLLPLIIMAYLRGDLRRMWSEPFINSSVSKFQTV